MHHGTQAERDVNLRWCLRASTHLIAQLISLLFSIITVLVAPPVAPSAPRVHTGSRAPFRAASTSTFCVLRN